MLRTLRHDDVIELRFSTWRSRSVGLRVSAFVARGVLIDTGFPDCRADLARHLSAMPVDGCVVTHFHEDHAGGVATVARAGVALWMDERTAARVSAPAPVGFYRRYAWGSPVSAAPAAPFTLPPAMTCIYTPGHSDDHHVIWDNERSTLFGGDLFIGVKVRGSHRNEEPRRLVRSLRECIALNPARLFDAHRGVVDAPVPLLQAKADWMERTLDDIDTCIVRGHSDVTIARAVLGNDWFSRAFTAGDYTMENFVAAARGEGR
jgi:glyoxylase-like metal-dependent hydrolase (beta-lactamase superfamily II)